ncbi:MAG TPA: hypothetical protein PKA10_09565 [Selenomonadales bacterium]|nr:hypothetical protein [Selenomonadales bacterium]
MITDSGAELLLAAIYRQAREDLEEAAAKVVLLQKACRKGQLPQYVTQHGLPLAAEEEATAAEWYEGCRRLPRELAELVGLVGQYARHCRHCAAAGRGSERGRMVQ